MGAFSSTGPQFLDDLLTRLEASEFVGEELEGCVVEVGEGRCHAVGG